MSHGNGGVSPDPGTDAAAPLHGLRVVEFAQIIAGPLAGTLLADLGADVIHVEKPDEGDAARRMGPTKNGVGLWWKVLGRNKRSVTLDLNAPEAREVVDRLVKWADVLITSFRATTTTRFGLDWERVHDLNPSVILLQVSGYGARTSRRDKPGFGKMGEARSGVVHITGEEDGRPIHTGFSHGDATTGLMGAFGIVAALLKRARDPDHRGEWIDLALSDTLFRLIEWQVILYDQLGIVADRRGNQLPVAPAAVINTYQSAEGDWLTVTSATSKSVTRIVELVGLDEADFDTHEDQLRGQAILDRALRDWIAKRTTSECLREMDRRGVVASKVFSTEDILLDETFNERDSIVTVTDRDLGPIRMQGVVPDFVYSPTRIWRAGPDLGEDTQTVLEAWLGFSREQIEQLAARRTI